MEAIDYKAQITKLEKSVRLLEKKLSSCMEMRKKSEDIVDSQNMLFEKIRKELEESKQVISQQHREIRSILVNIKQGIVVVTPELKVNENYSAHVSEIVGRKPEAGEPVDQLLFRDSSLSKDSVSQIVSVISACAGEPDFMFTCNRHRLPEEYVLYSPDGEKIIECDWSPIVNEEFNTEKLIITLRDVTEIRKLRKATEEKAEIVKMISEIISHDFESVVEFLDKSSKMIDDNVKLIEAEQKAPEVLDQLFRNAHTVKGNARAFAFEKIVNQVHHLETFYQEVRQNISLWNSEQMLNDANKVLESLSAYYTTLKEKLRFQTVNKEDLDFEGEVAAILKDGDRENPKECMGKIVSLYERHYFRPLRALLRTPLDSLANVAAQIGKPAPMVVCDNTIGLHKDLSSLLVDVFNHCLRNSVDHGIEDAETREKKGKKPEGQIKLDIELDEPFVNLTLEDDGAGLNLERLRQKAESAGVIGQGENDDEKIAEVIFHSGVSTAQKVSDISGRGVGMDAVRSMMRAQGGQVKVKFTGPRNDQGFRPFKLVISVPMKNNICFL